MGDGDLLKRAVVSLEKKLRDSAASVSALQSELHNARQEAADLPAVRGRLAEAVAARGAAEDQAQQSQREAAAAQAAVQDAQRHRERATEAAREAEELAARQAGAAEQWRADAEALRLEAARARGQAELLEQQVQQLEATNAGLRQDNQRNASKLKEAYEREGELLAQMAELQAQLRQHQQVQRAGAPGASSGAGGLPAPTSRQPASDPGGSMEQMHRELFLAAAQQLTAEFSAKVEQAERRASQLEQQLDGLARPAELLQRQVGELRAELQACQEQCSREQAAAASLLDANLRLHETVMQLLEQGSGQGQGQRGTHDPEGDSWQQGPVQQQQQAQVMRPLQRRDPPAAAQHRLSRPGGLPAAALCQQQAQPGRAGGARQAAAAARLARGQPAEPARSRLAGRGQQLELPLRATPAAPGVLQRRLLQQEQQQQQQQPAPMQQQAAARQAAVEAALSLSAEHRELHAYHKAVGTELQRVASCLKAVAAPGKQLALLRQHAELQEELREVAAQLEDKVVQLTALRHAGLL